MTRELLVRTGALSAPDALGASRDALDRPLAGDAELSVAVLTTEATVLGAFQRRDQGPLAPGPLPILRRISGGPFVWVGPGTVHVVLALAHPAALVPCDARRIVNRYVRPLLRAMAKVGAHTHYFGRDWLSLTRRPVGQVGFAHDSRSGRAVFEAFVAVASPFAPEGRASFLRKEPVTVESVLGRSIDLQALVGAIVTAYADATDRVPLVSPLVPSGAALEETALDPPWAASVEEAIGLVAAGRDAQGVLRLGGDLLASRDALERVASRVAALPAAAWADAIRAIVDAELTPATVGLDGVRDLGSVRAVLWEALSRGR